MRTRHYSLLALLIGLSIGIASCGDDHRELREAEQSEFRHYVDSLDTLQMERCLQRLLQSDTSSWKANRVVRKRYETTRDFAQVPLWFSRMGVSAEADSLLSILRRSLPVAGLDTAAFFVPQIANDLKVVRLLAFDSLKVNINELLPRLDYMLSKAYVRYCVGQRYGFIRPDKILNQLESVAITEDKKEFKRLFDYDVQEPNYDEGLHALSSGDRLGYLHGSSPKGKVYEALRAEMHSTADAKRRKQLAINMERCRWQPRQADADEKKVVVNIPALQLWAVCPDSVLNMRICCGTVINKTPLLCSKINYMDVNPDWIVPLNIVRTDFVRHEGDSAYFARNRYYIVERSTGDTLNPVNVTADEMLSGRLRVGQKGGNGNSLGRIVFRFPNDYGVYLHDTNNRKAFSYQRRTLSHGCIRVQKPFELACFLLPESDEWLLDQVRISMDLPPVTAKGMEYLEEHAEDERPLRLVSRLSVTPRVPVYIVYFTAYPNPETSRLEYWPDLYGYDKAIANEMSSLLQK